MDVRTSNDDTPIEVSSTILDSEANGPGSRNVIHFQGCSLKCPGCFNQHTHPSGAGTRVGAGQLVKELQQNSFSTSYTISGGEPFQQPKGLLFLLGALRSCGVDSILIFSGYTIREIKSDPVKERCLSKIDVLVAGRYNRRQPSYKGLRASKNQKVHFLTNRHASNEFEEMNNTEVHVLEDGNMVVTGFPSKETIELLRGGKQCQRS